MKLVIPKKPDGPVGESILDKIKKAHNFRMKASETPQQHYRYFTEKDKKGGTQVLDQDYNTTSKLSLMLS